MKWFMYHQNNSGGSFFGPELICIEAPDAEIANVIARRHGVYFNGVEDGSDCECCGDRWYSAHGAGDKEPNDYGRPVDTQKNIDHVARSTLIVPFEGGVLKAGDWSYVEER